jgi:porin-like protein
VGLAWIADGVFGSGTQIELTRVWSALAAYEHIWNPKWRTAWGGGYVNVDYNSAATNLINARLPGAGPANCGVVAAGATIAAFTPAVGNSCSPDYSFWEAYTRTQWNPVPQLDIGLQVMYTHHNTAYKGAAALAANGSRPAVVNGIIDDQNVWSAMFRWQRNFYP